MYRQIFVLVVIICTHLYSYDRYVGFDDAVPSAWHPGLGLTMKQSKLLERMRLEGPYGPKEMAAYKEWRQSTFESNRQGDHHRNTANSISYPLNAIAAFIQWCYPCPGEIMLEPNVNCHDPLGTLAKLWGDDREQASTCFSVIMKAMDTLYDVDVTYIEDMALAVRAEITEIFLKDTPRLDVFLDVFISAIYLERFERPVYYPEETVRKTFISYLTDIIHDKAQVVEVYRKSGLLKQEPVDVPMTREAYDALSAAVKADSKCTFDTFVQFLILQDQFGSMLPPFLMTDRSTVQVADGDSVSFADCGETAFLNFCLTFLWGQQKVNPERWSTLKDKYPNFRLFVEFFETHKTLAGIEGNRSRWATLMAFKKQLIETSPNKIDYNRRGRAELVGGNQSFLNLMSILFAEDGIMCSSFETEKLTSQNDIDLAQKKWCRLIDILSCHQQYSPRLDDEKTSFKSNAELYFSLGELEKENNFRFVLHKNHFCLHSTAESRSLSIQVLNKETDAAITTLLGRALDMWSVCTPFFFLNGYYVSDIPKSINEHETITIILRQLMRFSQNCMDDEYVIKKVVDNLKALHTGEALKDVLSKLVKHPLGKVFLYQHVVPNVFLSDEYQELKDALQTILTDKYFKEMLESSHPNKYQLLCFYGKQFYALKKIKRSPDHPGHNIIFKGPVHEKHPLIMAAKNGQMDIVNLITDDGAANFWKVGLPESNGKVVPEPDLDGLYLLIAGIENQEMIRFLKDYNPEIFKRKKRIDYFRMLGRCSVASYDVLFGFLCDYHRFSEKELLKSDCREAAYDEMNELSEVHISDVLLCTRCYRPDYEWMLSRELVQKITPNYKVSQAVFLLMLNSLFRCRIFERIPYVLSYAESDVIRESLETMPFDANQAQSHMQELEVLYPYFSIKTWEKVLSGFLGIDDDSVTWRALNSLFANMAVPLDLIQEVKKLLLQKRGEAKLFLLGLFHPNTLPNDYGDSWKEACHALSTSALYEMQEHLAKVKEQMEQLSASAA